MDDDTFNVEIRKFLKRVGITSQREIERAVRAAVDDGRLQGSEKLDAQVVLRLPALQLDVTIDGDIALE